MGNRTQELRLAATTSLDSRASSPIRIRSVSSAVALLVATLAGAELAAGATHSELSGAASALSGRQVQIHCSKELGHLGLVFFRLDLNTGELVPDDFATLRRSVCLTLMKLPQHISWKTPKAILVLAHESAHLRGVVDEQAAECEGLANVTRVAKLLGLSDAEANWIKARAQERTFCRNPVATPEELHENPTEARRGLEPL